MALTVGVLGGMGPAATVAFLARLIALTSARRDADHLRVLTDCNPQVPDRNAGQRGDGPSPGPVLAAMALGLERQGAKLLAMPCNAAHAFADNIRAEVSIPFVSMIDEAANAIARDHPAARRVGLLAVDGTLAANLYQRRLPDTLVLAPDRQVDFMALVRRVKAGDVSREAAAGMAALAGLLAAAGADVILAACTEVPLILTPAAAPVPLVDAGEVLARQVVARART